MYTIFLNFQFAPDLKPSERFQFLSELARHCEAACQKIGEMLPARQGVNYFQIKWKRDRYTLVCTHPDTTKVGESFLAQAQQRQLVTLA